MLRVIARSRAGVQSVVGLSHRTFFGGKKPQKIDPNTTEFDLLIVGGLNAACLGKFIEADGAFKGKMGIVTSGNKFLNSQNYFLTSYGCIKTLKYETATAASMVGVTTKMDINTTVTRFRPEENQVDLHNGKTYTYKALVIATGLEHGYFGVEGLEELDRKSNDNGVTVHLLDATNRIPNNHWHGYYHPRGDFIVYHPGFPYRGEGGDFYAFYYEHQLRQAQLVESSTADARIVVMTPNDRIYNFDYANQFVLEECRKRRIDVEFNKELLKVEELENGMKIATVRNTQTGEIETRPFFTLSINPPARPVEAIRESSERLSDSKKLVPVNPLTLQHTRFQNIFAFGDCTNIETTRNIFATAAQMPVVKHNVQAFLKNNPLDAVYDGYSWWPLVTGMNEATSFSHLHGYEPHRFNNVVPQHGALSILYHKYLQRSLVSFGTKYSGMKKNSGPPYYRVGKKWPPVESNPTFQRFKDIQYEV